MLFVLLFVQLAAACAAFAVCAVFSVVFAASFVSAACIVVSAALLFVFCVLLLFLLLLCAVFPFVCAAFTASFGPPTVEPPPLPLLTFQNENNNVIIDGNLLTSKKIKNNFLYHQNRIWCPKKKPYCLLYPKEDFCTQNKTHPHRRSLPIGWYVGAQSHKWSHWLVFLISLVLCLT